MSGPATAASGPGLLTRRPAPPLGCFVESLWHSQRPALSHAREWGLPSGCADLLVPLGDGDEILRWRADGAGQPWRTSSAVLQGVQQRAFLRSTSRPARTAGVHFRPAGLAALTAVPAHELTDRVLPLDAVWGLFAHELQQRLAAIADPEQCLLALEQMLLQRLRPGSRPGLAAWALPRLMQGEAVASVQRASGLGSSTFVQRFRLEAGVSPKQQLALLRFAAAARRGHAQSPWAEVSLDCGYADQPHLSREFKRFAGMTPGAYRRQATAHALHVAAR